MMQSWRNLFIVLLIVIGFGAISFDGMLYNVCQQEKNQMQAMKDKQTVEYEFNSSKFKYEEEQIRSLKEDLEDTRSQIKEQNDDLSAQKDTLLQEVQKRQAIEDEDKSILSSLDGIQAAANATRDDMKSWQKDYVTVLAQLGTKMDNTQAQIKSMDDNLTALNLPQLRDDVNALQTNVEKISATPQSNDPPQEPAQQEQKIERSDLSS